jgi:hypothetical protein
MGAGMLMIAGTGSAVENCLALIGFIAAQLGMVLAAEGLPAMPLLLLGLAIVQFRQAMRAAPVKTGSDDPRSAMVCNPV